MPDYTLIGFSWHTILELWKTADMKILFVGATGSIGSEVLEQCLAHPEITSIIAFSRRELPAAVISNPKLQVIIKNDFSSWEKGELEPHADAVAMAW